MVDKSVTGFVVVRKPEYYFEAEGQGADPANHYEFHGNLYSGFDRMPWHDIDVQLNEDKIAESERRAYLEFEDKNNAFSGLIMTQDLEYAIQLLSLANRVAERNEIICVQSKELAEISQVSDKEYADIEILPLGMDPLVIGLGSLLPDGMYTCEEVFAKWITKITPHGLLSREEDVYEYFKEYQSLEDSGEVELLTAGDSQVIAVRVGKVLVSR